MTRIEPEGSMVRAIVELQSDGTTQKKWVFELTEDDLKEDVSSGSGESGESR